MIGKHTLKTGVEYETNTLDSFTKKENVVEYHAELFRSAYHYMDGEVSSRIPSAYFQDSWAVASRLQINTGIRWDGQYFYDANGHNVQNITNQLQPRLGFIYQPGKVGTQQVYGHY